MSTTTTIVKKSWIAARLSEPSTYAGIGIILTMLAPIIEQAATSTTWAERAVIILTGAAAIVKKEGL